MQRLKPLALAGLLLLVMLPALAQLIGAGRSLELIETASFSIYYPRELSGEAMRLASFAEELLDAEVGRFGARPEKRLPVLLTDQFPETNGSYTPLPSDRIVLEIAPFLLNDETASIADQLRGVFAHELAHALSLSTRPPLLSFAATIFGDPVQAALLTGPPLLSEGTAICAESSDRAGGLGRAWDPLAASPIRQSLAENRNIGFWEATSASGLYPFGASAYTWGGPFAAWLEERYGTGALERLYRELGALRFPEDGLWKGAFSKAFGRDLDPLWKDFLDSMRIQRPLVTATKPLVGKPGYITALTAGRIEGILSTVWADSSEGAVLALRQGDSQPRRLFEADGHVNRLDLSSDGRFLLVSTASSVDGFTRLVAKVWDLRKSRFTGNSYFDLREAAWAGEVGDEGEGRVVGIAISGMKTDLVEVDGASRRVILRGGPTRSYGGPVVLADGMVYTLALEKGRSLLVRIGGDRLRVLATNLPLERLRFLSGRGRDLTFGFSSGDGFYRLALLREVGTAGQRLSLQEMELSGGVQRASLRSDPGENPEVSYLAAFSDGEYPADYPFALPALALRDTGSSWIALDDSFGDPKVEVLPLTASSFSPAPPLPLALSTFRYPVVSTDLGSAGLEVEGADISGRFSWAAVAEYAWMAGAANLGASLGLALAPWNLDIAASDRFSKVSEMGFFRQTRADLQVSRFFPGFPSRRGLLMDLLLSGGGLAQAPSGAPYGYPYLSLNLGTRASATWKDSHAAVFAPFEKRGFEAGLALDTEWRPGKEGVPGFASEALLDAWLPVAGLHLRVEAAASVDGSLGLGPSGRKWRDGGPSILDPGIGTWTAYAGLGAIADWYGRADFEFRLADLEIMRRVHFLGLYARRAILSCGIRGGGFGDFGSAPLGLASMHGDLAIEFTPLLGLATRGSLAAEVDVDYALNPDLAPQPWHISFSLGTGH
ncbi:MAG: hypothetical protein WCL50_04365 [Spirochaetota bacterium]